MSQDSAIVKCGVNAKRNWFILRKLREQRKCDYQTQQINKLPLVFVVHGYVVDCPLLVGCQVTINDTEYKCR